MVVGTGIPLPPGEFLYYSTQIFRAAGIWIFPGSFEWGRCDSEKYWLSELHSSEGQKIKRSKVRNSVVVFRNAHSGIYVVEAVRIDMDKNSDICDRNRDKHPESDESIRYEWNMLKSGRLYDFEEFRPWN